ncbi:MAG TPA: hypothetical protein VL200_06205 [Lacunisphaera sp.]|nr:hypothetical protein [Lacunisphaera sp.]
MSHPQYHDPARLSSQQMSELIAKSQTEDELAPYQFSDLDFGPAIELRPIWPEGTGRKTQVFELVVTAQPDEWHYPEVRRGFIEITALHPEALDGPIDLVVRLTPPVPLPPPPLN